MSGNYNIQIIGIFIGLVVVGILYGIGQIVKAKDKNKETFGDGQEKIVKFIVKNWILFLIIVVIIVIYFIRDVFFNRNTPVA